MRVVLQRVRRASVTVSNEVVGAVDTGLLILLGVSPEDGPTQVDWMAKKVSGLRIFADESGRMNASLLDIGGGALVVSQFTLYGNCRKGRRPSFAGAARPEHAEPLYVQFCEALTGLGVPRVERGVFGAMMDVELLNDGPVTLILDSP